MDHHLCLEPFFRDNLSLQQLYRELGKCNEELREVLEQDLIPEDKPMYYTGRGRSAASGFSFSENVWTRRLTGGLAVLLPN